MEKIVEGCYSENGNIFVFLIPGGYAEFGKIYKFNTIQYDFEEATILYKGFLGSPQEFGKRDGNVIKLIGIEGDAGCSVEFFYDYDFVKNEVKLEKRRDRC